MKEQPHDEPAPKPNGRPRAEEPGTVLTAWVPTSEYDRLVKLAAARGDSLSKVVRDLIRRK